ncbi:MAG: recombinase family protein [Pseudomonadota bacterium]|nr:recombinase family protein [Pseudomonadota bacterium]
MADTAPGSPGINPTRAEGRGKSAARGSGTSSGPAGGAGRVRCAIYTRKSTEEGLEQAFNSLDAQREACSAYIRSQQHEGWIELPDHYDDGGFSGGSMERPALIRLLDDIAAGRIDTVVVYKVDRLTRALADFARIVDLFERHAVSFVSVTQQFNTTTSMGRLTLNVLLSFAQFEREVTAERIRDKFAASRRKGMWMGGGVPPGYRVDDRELVVDPEGADLVRRIFNLYLELGSVPRLHRHLCDAGMVTPVRTSTSGRERGGRALSRGKLHTILRNPDYVGKARHKGQVHKGRHAAIIDRACWDTVQARLDQGVQRTAPATRATPVHLLAGRLFDAEGEPLYATQSHSHRRRYGYYTSKALVTAKTDSKTAGWRIGASRFDRMIATELANLLRDPVRVIDLFGRTGDMPDRTVDLVDRAAGIAEALEATRPEARMQALHHLVERIILHTGRIDLVLRRIDQPEPSAVEHRAGDTETMATGTAAQATVTISLPVRVARRGVEARLVLQSARPAPEARDPALVGLIGLAWRWQRILGTGEVTTLAELAAREGIDRSEIGRVLHLANLAPDIIEAILDGRQPPDLTASRLKRMADLPPDWSAQRKMPGFVA